MELIDEKYQHDPTYGARRMQKYLLKRHGYKVNLKRIRRLMKKMGLRGISPPKKTTISMEKGYTNLIKNLFVNRPNRVWCADITYVKVLGGFGYGVAIIDLYSRKVLSMEVSNSMGKEMCLEAAKEAIKRYGVPEIIHTDKGRQFMSDEFIRLFKEQGVKISVGDMGFRDNIYIERFWRTYKYECIYLREINTLKDLREITKEWVSYYNSDRLHQSLEYRTPNEVYYGTVGK